MEHRCGRRGEQGQLEGWKRENGVEFMGEKGREGEFVGEDGFTEFVSVG